MTDAQRELAADSMKLVYHIAHKGWDRQYPWDDLVSAGCEGLIKAAMHYDPSRGRWSTFAGVAIANAIKQYAERERRWRDRHVAGDLDESMSRALSYDDARFEVVEDRIDARRAVNAVRKLPALRRGVLEAIYLEGRTSLEIAQERGVQRGAINHLRRQGLRDLRRAVGA